MATARVACCAALVGCIGGDKAPDSAADSQASVDSSTGADSGEDSSDPLAECEEHVEGIFTHGATPTSETEACCQMIAENYDELELEGLEDWTERDDCCELLQWQGSMACTPWGPPCPPKMVS